jgi:hypothetical protein
VIKETLDGEALIVHTRTGAYYSLQGRCVFIWESLLAGRTVGQVAEAFDLGSYRGRDEMLAGLARFVATLLEEQLIREDVRGEVDGNGTPRSSVFEMPNLQKYRYAGTAAGRSDPRGGSRRGPATKVGPGLTGVARGTRGQWSCCRTSAVRSSTLPIRLTASRSCLPMRFVPSRC